ncbi:hypothetical protein ACWGNU_01950 [Paenibacillus lautus]
MLDQEKFVQNTDQYEEKIPSGRVLGIINADWGFGNPTNALRTAGKENLLMRDSRSTWMDDQGCLVLGCGLCCRLERKHYNIGQGSGMDYQVLDYLASEEGRILLNWGSEGEHYDVADGKRIIPEDVRATIKALFLQYIRCSGL